MFVKTRKWSEAQFRFNTGKVHWMTKPWVTKCGIEMGKDWQLNHKWQRYWSDGCKRCGIDVKDET